MSEELRKRGPRGPDFISPHRKGGEIATRQGFSLSPTLLASVFATASKFNEERNGLIARDRTKRVPYSKIVATLIWLLKEEYLTPEGELTDRLRALVIDYEASPYEQRDADVARGAAATRTTTSAASRAAESSRKQTGRSKKTVQTARADEADDASDDSADFVLGLGAYRAEAPSETPRIKETPESAGARGKGLQSASEAQVVAEKEEGRAETGERQAPPSISP